MNLETAGEDSGDTENYDYVELTEDNVAELDDLKENEISFYLEMLGDNYHLAPFEGFSLKVGDKVYVSKDIAFITRKAT